MKSALLALAALGLAHAQFTDLQPGRNFPSVVDLTVNDRTESIDVGDVDLDGDLDIVFGIGGDVGPASNRIFVNQGGLQGGTEGAFVEETATRFAGIPFEPTRDLDFGDIDGDGDLDIVEASRGVTSGVGSVMRVYVNQGGRQGGTVGHFAEGTDEAWGSLVNVPPGDQVLGGDTGPWRNWSCDCDFGDLDDDGDLDLFASSYGPGLNGTQKPSRVFLNDGSGVFHEQWPWAPPASQALFATLDVELVDIDTDFDLDVFISELGPAPGMFVNNTHAPIPGASTAFTETTQASIVDPGAGPGGSFTYDVEFQDLDGDGDFELWMANYASFDERVLDTTSAVPGEAPVFTALDLTFANPNSDEEEFDFLDFDGDGDLDAISANHSGTNNLFVNGSAQGIDEFHRAGSTIADYAFPETPESGNGNQSMDVEAADFDGDGATDYAIANEVGADRVMFNTLGVPDTHAPTFARVTEPDGLALAGEVVIHASVRDNHPVYIVAFHDVDLVVSVDGGPEQRIDMTHSGSMIFRAALDLGAGASSLEYRIEAVDGAGNVGISDTFVATGDWTDLGGGLAGVDGIPTLSPSGTLAPGATGTLALTEAAPSAAALLALSAPTAGAPFKGGTLLAVPFDLAIQLTTSPSGTLALPYAIPGDAPSGVAFHLQLLVADLAAIQGIALSNGLRGDVP